MTKCKGGCQMRAGGKTCKKCGCDMEDEEYEKGEKEEKEMRSGGSACMKCGGKMHKSGGTVSSCMKCGGGKYTFGGKVKWTKKYANGGEINVCPPGYMKIGNDCVEIKTVMNMYKTPKQYGLSAEELLKESEIPNNNQQYLMPGLSDEEIRMAMDNPNAKEMTISNNTTTPNKFLPFYLGQDRYDNGGHMSKGLEDVFYGINEQNFYPTGLENKPVNQNYLAYKLRKSASTSGASYMFGGEVNWLKKKVTDKYAFGGAVNTGCPDGMVKDPITGECVYPYTTSNPNDPRIKLYSDSLYSYNRGYELAGDLGKKFDNYTNNDDDYENKFKNAYLNKNNNFVGTLNGPPMTRNELNKKNNEIGWANKHYGEYTKLPVNPHSTAIFSELPPIVKYKAPVQPVIYKPEVRVPVAEYTQQDLDNAFKQKREQEELEVWNKWIAENPLPEPEPRMNDEMEITYYKPIDMQTKSPELIPTNDITSNVNTGMKYQKESGQGAYPTMSSEEQGMTNKKGKKKYAVGGMVNDCPTGYVKDSQGNCVPSEDLEMSLKNYRDEMFLYNTRQNLLDAINDKTKTYEEIKKLQEMNLGFKVNHTTGFTEQSQNPIYKNKIVLSDKWENDIDQKRMAHWRVKEYQKPAPIPMYIETKKPGLIPINNVTSNIMTSNSQGTSEQGAYNTYTPNNNEGAGKESNSSSPIKKVYAGPDVQGRLMSDTPGYFDRTGFLEKGRSLEEQYADDPSVILNPKEFIKNRKKFSFGGAVSGMKKYLYGGEIDNTAMTTDAEMPLSKGAYDVPEPTYDASVVSNESPMQVTDNVTQGTEQLGYKEIVQSFQKKNIDKSLPNWGYAKQEQIKLNELIRKDISAGNAKMDLLVEDDIIGDNTLRAMRAYEANGQYTRPEGFKDKWLAEYKKQWDEMQVTGKSKANVPKDNNIIDQPKKAESKTMLDEMYSYFNPSSQKKKDMPVGYGTVLKPEEPKPKAKSMAAKYSAEKYSAEKYAKKSGGWPKASLLLEGGIEVSTSDMQRKDFDTYFPIPGASKPGSKGVRATGRDNNKSFFDAVEKAQSKRKDSTSNNTSLQLIDKLLSSSKKAIVIPKGEDKYGREIKDIYLQDPFYPDKYHALDSLGVVEGEAIFGMDVEPKVGSLTKRQEEITKIAKKKGGYKYDQSPYDYRRSKRY